MTDRPFWLTDNLHPSDHVLLPELYYALIRHQALKNFLTDGHCVCGKYEKHADRLVSESRSQCTWLCVNGIEESIEHAKRLEVFGPQQMIELNERIKRIHKVIGAL